MGRRSGTIIWLILLLAGAIGALASGGRVYSRLLAAGALLIAATWLMTLTSLWGLRVTRGARSLKASVGDLLEENFEISNPTPIPRLWVEVENASLLPAASG